MLAGHTMLAIFGGFAASIGLFAIFPVGINIALFGLEFLVAVLQAYVFAILTCLYLNDAVSSALSRRSRPNPLQTKGKRTWILLPQK